LGPRSGRPARGVFSFQSTLQFDEQRIVVIGNGEFLEQIGFDRFAFSIWPSSRYKSASSFWSRIQ